MELVDALNEFLLECELKHFSPRTIKGYRNNCEYLINYLTEKYGIKEIKQVSSSQLKNFFLYQIERGRKETYINGMLKCFRSFFKYLTEEEYLTDNPILKVKWAKEPKTVIKTFSDIEVKQMVQAYNEKDFLSIRNKAIICMLFDTGIRNFELCSLQNNNIHERDILIWGKGNKERFVGKSPYLSKILLKYERYKKYYFEYKNIINDNYFLSRTGKPLTVEAVERIVKIAGNRANVSKSIRCSPHTCRHYFAQAQLRNGMDVYSLSRVLGHGNIKITQRYLEGLHDHDVVDRSIKTSPLMNL